MPTLREEMRIVARRLQPLNVPFAFVGGAVMCLLVDHPEVTQFRRTKDIDVIVAVITYAQFAELEGRFGNMASVTIRLKARRFAAKLLMAAAWISCPWNRRIWA